MIYEVVVMLRLTKNKRERQKTLSAAVVGKDHLLSCLPWNTHLCAIW